jgi:hypothetical protein
MIKYFFAILFFFVTLSTQAKPQCLALFERQSAIEILETINAKYSNQIYSKSVDENIHQSSFLIRNYKLFKLKRLFRNLEKNGQGFDNFELATFVYKLDKLAFAEAIESNADYAKKLSGTEKAALSEARRSLMSEGIIKHFGLNQKLTGILAKTGQVLSVATSWKYWRWSMAWMVMPKLVGFSLPPELAHKILLDGLDAHRVEAEKYMPFIKTRSGFNKFSKIYNYTVVAALFTVVPYLTHAYYVEQMQLGIEHAKQIYAPLVQNTYEMSQVDQLMQKELGALEKYVEAYNLKYGHLPTEAELDQVRKVIHERVNNAPSVP